MPSFPRLIHVCRCDRKLEYLLVLKCSLSKYDANVKQTILFSKGTRLTLMFGNLSSSLWNLLNNTNIEIVKFPCLDQ